MSIFPKRNGYAESYSAMRMQALDWTVGRLSGRMRAMLDQDTVTEANWGAIDALAELLGGISPPSTLPGAE